jgi:hypothetical protein
MALRKHVRLAMALAVFMSLSIQGKAADLYSSGEAIETDRAWELVHDSCAIKMTPSFQRFRFLAITNLQSPD